MNRSMKAVYLLAVEAWRLSVLGACHHSIGTRAECCVIGTTATQLQRSHVPHSCGSEKACAEQVLACAVKSRVPQRPPTPGKLETKLPLFIRLHIDYVSRGKCIYDF